jgi:5-methylcytosine-specific restriction endonuclease McrA
LIDLLQAHPEGLDMTQIRQKIGGAGTQEQLGRRVRDLRKKHDVPCIRQGARFVYTYKGTKAVAADGGKISGKLRAAVLNLAKGCCQMCGRTIAHDGVKLQVDHKIPESWGGLSVQENLWAICEQCNHGKRDHFKSFDTGEMQEIIAYSSVHERIAHLLKLHMGKPVESTTIEFVANAREQQEDWQKRLRDLRYPVIGLKITSGRYKTPQGFWRSTYTLHNWIDLPANHRQLIQAWDKPASRAKLKKQLGIK